MKKQALTFIVGILIGAMLFGGIATIASPLTATPTPHNVYVDGEPVTMEAYLINSNNFFKLRDILAALDVGVWYEPSTGNIYIETDKTYDPDYQGPEVEKPFSAKAVSIPGKREAGIPAIFTVPTGDGPFPVVILCHGHGGSKDEAGGFVVLSEALALAGIASIRMDFPGCGDSKEDFVTQNNIANMLDDIESAKAYIAKDAKIDMEKLGILGYSMGGRLTMLAAEEDYLAAVLWAPAGTPGPTDMFVFMQLEDQEAFEKMYATAKEDGKVTYTAIFGFEQTLGLQWFDDMIGFDPVAGFAGFKGDLLTIYGDEDIIIPPATAKAASEAAVNAKSSVLFEAKGADHGFGIYSEETELTKLIVDKTVAFFLEYLK